MRHSRQMAIPANKISLLGYCVKLQTNALDYTALAVNGLCAGCTYIPAIASPHACPLAGGEHNGGVSSFRLVRPALDRENLLPLAFSLRHHSHLISKHNWRRICTLRLARQLDSLPYDPASTFNVDPYFTTSTVCCNPTLRVRHASRNDV